MSETIKAWLVALGLILVLVGSVTWHFLGAKWNSPPKTVKGLWLGGFVILMFAFVLPSDDDDADKTAPSTPKTPTT